VDTSGVGLDVAAQAGQSDAARMPLIPREVVVDAPGAGALGDGLDDLFVRWVLVVETTGDHRARRTPRRTPSPTSVTTRSVVHAKVAWMRLR